MRIKRSSFPAQVSAARFTKKRRGSAALSSSRGEGSLPGDRRRWAVYVEECHANRGLPHLLRVANVAVTSVLEH